MTRAVSLDAGNTLLHCRPTPPEIYAAHLSRHGRPVTPEEAAAVFRRVWAGMQREVEPGRDRYGAFPGGERGWWLEFVRRVVRELEHDAAVEPLFEALYAAFTDPAIWHLYPDVEPALDELGRRGLQLLVVSNWDRRLPALLERLGIAHRFRRIVVSALEGVEKPSPEIFRRAAAAVGTAPEELLHVGDSPREDYAGARAAGCRAVLLDREGLFAGDGYRRVRSLLELPEAV